MLPLLWLFTLVVAQLNSHAFPTNGTVAKNTLTSIEPSYDYRQFHYQGIALGGWLVLEPYITPSLFLQFNATNSSASIPVDEYHFCKQLGRDEAEKQLKQHWLTWFTEEDFADIKNYGFNMVRIPIGYWAFHTLKDDPYVPGAADYLDQALEWAKNHDLKVWVDLHGVPGLQNGFDLLGYRDIGYPGWFNSTTNVNVTYQVLNTIFTKYGLGDMAQQYKDTLLGIEVVNEPLGGTLDTNEITKFMKNAYINAGNLMELKSMIVFHDAFQPTSYWNEFLNTSDNIIFDHHKYEVFTEEQQPMNITEHMNNIKGLAEGISNETHPAVVGEWSAALTDCTPWLNGVGLGSRYAGDEPYNFNRTGSCDSINDINSWLAKKRKDTRKFIEMQLDQYESKMNGWIFWCYKTETSIEWDFKRLVEYDMFPQPFSNRTYIKDGKDTDLAASAVVPGWLLLLLALPIVF